MKFIAIALTALVSVPSFADATAEQIAYVLKDSAVAQAIDAAVAEGQQSNQKSWFKGAVISETPTSCKGDRQTFVLLYGRDVEENGKTVVQKCSQLVHFGDCATVTNTVGDIEKSPRCKPAK